MHRNCYTLLQGRPLIVDRALQQSLIDSQLFAQNRYLCLPRRNIAMTLGMDGYPMVKNNEDRSVIRFDRIHERDGRTDRHRMTA